MSEKNETLPFKISGWAISIAIVLICFVLIILLLFSPFWLYQKYNLWASSMRGEAELRQAEWNRQIVVKEAYAKKDAAKALAEAEIERAKGVAQANKIIGDSLKGNEDYLRYLWIDSLTNTKDQIIYVPTEAGLPILESGRVAKPKIDIQVMKNDQT